MKEQITIDKAILKGHLTVNVPVALFMFGTPFLGFYLGNIELIPKYGIAISFFLGFGIAWLYWSYRITKWRIWAFENVRNVHALKKRAIQEGLIWKDNKWYERTEIRSESDKLKWKKIQIKFQKDDVFQEDLSAPTKTIIYYSKIKNTYELLMMLICFGLGLYLFLFSDSYFMGSILTLAGAYLSIKEFKQVTDNRPQITIDNQGISTISTAFKNWDEIKNEDVIMEGSGRSRRFYLVYEFHNGKEYLNIDDYKINQKKLINLLRTYRIRSRKNYR